jgi:hypothetical protein
MTARSAGALASLVALSAIAIAGCSGFYEIPIETPIQPKMDVTGFQRVLVAGFVSGGTEDVDANLETVRLLRSQLRTKSPLRVIEADVLPLAEIAAEQSNQNRERAAGSPAPTDGIQAVSPLPNGASALPQVQMPPADPAEHSKDPKIKNDRDLQKYDKIFADVAYWKKLGEEYQNPLIVTGTILFTPHQQAGFVTQNREVYDSFGRRSVIPVRTYMERKGFILEPRFIFIDGRTGATLYSEKFREEVLYNAQQNTPALSSYFELMDRLMPSFLSTLSAQKIRGTRVLLK